MVEERSNSRISDSTSCDAVTNSFGHTVAQCGERAALVLGIGVGVDEDDGDASRALVQKLLAQRRGSPRGSTAVPDAAVGERALVHFDAHVAVGDRDEIAPQAPGAAAVAPAHFEHVAKAARGDDADLRAAPFEQRVGADRGAVHDRARLPQRRRALSGRSRNPAPRRRAATAPWRCGTCQPPRRAGTGR